MTSSSKFFRLLAFFAALNSAVIFALERLYGPVEAWEYGVHVTIILYIMINAAILLKLRELRGSS